MSSFLLNHLLGVHAERTATGEEPVLHQFFASGSGVFHGVDIADGGHGGHLAARHLLLGCHKQISSEKLNSTTRYAGLSLEGRDQFQRAQEKIYLKYKIYNKNRKIAPSCDSYFSILCIVFYG